MSVVRRDTYRRWGILGVAIACLCALPTVVAALPVHAARIAPADLRAKVLAAADHPYQGYVQSDSTLNVPDLPQLGSLSSLLGGTTTIRTWFADQNHWRTDVLTDTGEQDLYQTPEGTTAWDFEKGQITQILGTPVVRLPRPADLVPPQLAVRLIHTASPSDPLAALPAKRIAGIAAPGFEIRPAAADTTIGRIDIWADPGTGVPLEVAVYAKGATAPVITTRFLDVKLTTPAASDVTFTPAPGLAISTARSSDIRSLLDDRARVPLPDSLAGQPAALTLAGYGAAVAGYGRGFGTFALLYLGDRLGDGAVTAAANAGATVIHFTAGTGWLIRTPLLTVLLAKSDNFDRVYLLAGFTSADLLTKAGGELLVDQNEQLACHTCQFYLYPPGGP